MTGPGPGGGRAIGPWGAAGVGLGAIVGGGVLALGGVAFASAGPAAVLAFALNGLIALVTALSFCEMSTRFPESGGTYTFAKKVLSVQSAFTLGWVVWFASIVAAALYALGFALFAGAALEVLGNAVTAGGAPSWLTGRPAMAALAAGAAIFYAVKLVRRSSGGGHWETIGKVIVFAVLIAGGLWVTARRPVEEVVAALRPFFPSGAAGVFRAMGYAFIAFQGFDLIAAVAGEIREPTRTIPRAMLASIGASLAIYLPLLFVVTCAGVPAGTAIDEAAADRPGTLMVEAVQHFMGPAGFWLVIVAAILSMLSALKANLLAASRVATAMAQDRTLPGFLGTLDPKRRTPVAAILACTALVIAIVAAVPDVAAAGAAASLIFLVSFTTVHWTAILARRRSTDVRTPFHAPLFPLVPVAGIAACGALAVFQGVTVPLAGFIAGIWLFAGIIIYAFLLSRRARLFDASVEGYQPDLVHMRGKNPLVLVPIANPASATAMVAVASALAPLGAGRVVLLSVIRPPVRWQPSEPPPALHNAQELLGRILSSSFASGVAPEALITVAQHPWEEIARVARTYGCESLLLGLSSLAEGSVTADLENLISSVTSDVVILRAPEGWSLEKARAILVPIAGGGEHDELRARLLGSLGRTGRREVVFLRLAPPGTPPAKLERMRETLRVLADDETPGRPDAVVEPSGDIAGDIVRRAAGSDLVVLGLRRLGRHQKTIGETALRIARETSCALLMICRK